MELGRLAASMLCLALALGGCATRSARDSELTASALAAQMQRRPVVLLGEVHDNAVQHAVRAQALKQLLQSGARPALAFEQFDRERQGDIERVRREPGLPGTARVDRLVALGARSWNWTLYRPYLQLALDFDLPIVAADLSRADAMRVSQQGFGAVFDESARAALGLDRLPDELLEAQQKAIELGHCHQMPADMLADIARAQIARDATLARSIQPYLARGVVLLTGNGHARRDLGVPRYLPAAELARVISIGLLEADTPAEDVPAGAFDAVFWTAVQKRADPCATLHLKMQQQGGPGQGDRPEEPSN